VRELEGIAARHARAGGLEQLPPRTAGAVMPKA
jgi:hypothetical protein